MTSMELGAVEAPVVRVEGRMYPEEEAEEEWRKAHC